MSDQESNDSGDYQADRHWDGLEERVSRLEQRLERIEKKLKAITTAKPGKSSGQRSDTADSNPPETASYKPPQAPPDANAQKEGAAEHGFRLRSDYGTSSKQKRDPSKRSNAVRVARWSFIEGSGWMNKLGAVLLIVGLLLLFKYSVDQGWITPAVRLAIGGLLSVGLMGWGLLTEPDRSRFRQVALGGGIAGFYITGFASYYLYQYLSFSGSWVFMLAITGLALYLSLRENEQVLAVLGLIGGFATPFLLYRQGEQYIDLILYTCLLLGVSGVLYCYRRWFSLLWVMFIGGLGVFGVTLAYGIFGESPAPLLRRWALQGALLWYLVLLWPLPMGRSWLSLQNSGRWGVASRSSLQLHQPLLALVLPLMVLIVSVWVWEWSVMQSGLIGLGCTVVLGGIYLMMDKAFGRNFKQAHLYSTFLVMAFSFWMLFGGDHLYAWLAGQMLLMHTAGYLTQDNRLIQVTHLLGLGVGLHLLDRMMEVNEWALIGNNLGEIVAIGAFAGSGYLLRGRDRESAAYGLFALAAFLSWIVNLFGPIDDGQMYITVIWGLIALLLLSYGYRSPLRIARYSGAGVLLLTLGKLVFFDLAHLDTIWRILLFIGFGLVLLLMGYFLSRNYN